MDTITTSDLNMIFSNKINISGNNDITDPCYRYKRDDQILKYEGNGNGKKTRFVNLNEISEQLYRNPKEISKFLGMDLCTSFIFTDSVAIFNGHIKKEDMEKSLKNYIELFVLCKQCKLPEIHKYKLSKKKGIKLKCLGCGFCGILDSDDHRLVSYIKAQISQDKKDKKDKKHKKDKKDKK